MLQQVLVGQELSGQLLYAVHAAISGVPQVQVGALPALTPVLGSPRRRGRLHKAVVGLQHGQVAKQEDEDTGCGEVPHVFHAASLAPSPAHGARVARVSGASLPVGGCTDAERGRQGRGDLPECGLL